MSVKCPSGAAAVRSLSWHAPSPRWSAPPDPSYRYFDVKVSGAEAKKLVQRYIGVDDPKQRPLVRFRLGDLWGDVYIRDKGEQKGQPPRPSRRDCSRPN